MDLSSVPIKIQGEYRIFVLSDTDQYFGTIRTFIYIGSCLFHLGCTAKYTGLLVQIQPINGILCAVSL